MSSSQNESSSTPQLPPRARVCIQSLPEDVLLRVFEELTAEDLLGGVQYVCRSWRRLVRDETLWRHRRLWLTTCSDWPTLVRALQAAPTLAHLGLASDVLKCYRSKLAGVLLRETLCRIHTLSLSGACDETADMEALLGLLEAQQAHLKDLSVFMKGSAWGSADAGDRLFQSISLMKALRCLNLRILSADPAVSSRGRLAQRVPRHPTLTTLNVEAFYDATATRLERGIQSLICAHATTLESVSLPQGTSGATVGLLARCPRLNCASLPCVSEVESLRDCPRVSALHILDLDMGRAGRKVRRFIRETPLLRDLFLSNVVEGVADAVETIATSKSVGNLRRLHLSMEEEQAGNSENVSDLAGVLSRMTALEELAGTLTVGVVDAINPATAPKLKLLEMHGMCCTLGEECFLPALRRLLQRYPSLHIAEFDGESYESSRSTGMCWLEHSRAGALLTRCGLFAHDPSTAAACEGCRRMVREGNELVWINPA